MTGQVFAVASGKGGVGKTTTVVNLGVTIRAEDHSVALVDADLGMANLATVLGIEHEPTLHDVLSGRAEIEEAIVEQADRFAIVPGSRDLQGFADADPTRLRDVIDGLAERYDFVIIDTGAGLSHEDLLPLGLADQVLLITTPDPSSVGDTRKVAGFSDILGKAVRGLVVTKSRTQSDANAAAEEFDTELLATIPDDPTVVESTAKGVPLEVFDPETPAASAYRKLAKKVTGESITAEHMPDELEEPTTRGEHGSSDKEPEATSDEATVVPDEDPMASTADSATEDTAEIEADSDVGEAQVEEAPPSVDAATDAEEPDEVGTEPLGTDLSEAEDLLSAGETADSDADAEEPSAIIEAPTVSETAEETEVAEDPAVEPDDEAMEPSDEMEGTAEAGAESMEVPASEEGESQAEDDQTTDAERAADDPESDEDESDAVEDESEESKGFFGRLFGVFR